MNLYQNYVGADKPTRKALDELSELFSYLRVWRIDKHVFIDPLMPPTESYHRDLFFQVSSFSILCYYMMYSFLHHIEFMAVFDYILNAVKGLVQRENVKVFYLPNSLHCVRTLMTNCEPIVLSHYLFQGKGKIITTKETFKYVESK